MGPAQIRMTHYPDAGSARAIRKLTHDRLRMLPGGEITLATDMVFRGENHGTLPFRIG